MKKTEVPQEDGMNEGMREIAYAVDEAGRYVKVSSVGWEPKNVANEQAWEVIAAEIDEAVRAVRAGEKSPLAYHMARHLMNPGLLADYAGLSRWRVRRHLKPRPFARLKPEILARYARVFNLTVADLRRVPDAPEAM